MCSATVTRVKIWLSNQEMSRLRRNGFWEFTQNPLLDSVVRVSLVREKNFMQLARKTWGILPGTIKHHRHRFYIQRQTMSFTIITRHLASPSLASYHTLSVRLHLSVSHNKDLENRRNLHIYSVTINNIFFVCFSLNRSNIAKGMWLTENKIRGVATATVFETQRAFSSYVTNTPAASNSSGDILLIPRVGIERAVVATIVCTSTRFAF